MSILVSTLRTVVPRSLRNALRKPSKTINRCKQTVRYFFGNIETIEPLEGWRIHCHPLCAEAFQILFTDKELKDEMLQFRTRCGPQMRLLDVGAHWGTFTLAASHFSGNSAEIVCVEPSPAVVKVLRANLELNQLERNVRVVQAAAGPQDSMLQMLTTGAGGLDFFVVPHEIRSDTVTVKQVSLTNLCNGLNFSPTHLKIDVEGFEEEVLCGAIGLLLACRPIIFLELHGHLIPDRGRKVLNLLLSAGYSRWYHAGSLTNASELEKCRVARLMCLPNAT